ncbi:MAG TPA: hypothetical protein DCP92_21550, partial [Nitrospiraceae bacterium]|nr:hypothetical protein [Nitrospiraceae bacterium]
AHLFDSRFLKGAAGLAALGSGGLNLLNKAEATGGPTETWPWPYVQLSPEKTAEIAYNDWYRLFCRISH